MRTFRILGFAVLLATNAQGGTTVDLPEAMDESVSPAVANTNIASVNGVNNTYTGTFAHANGSTDTYTVSSTVVSLSIYGQAWSAGTGVGDNRTQWRHSESRIRFEADWDAGDGCTGAVWQTDLTISFNTPSISNDVTLDLTSTNTSGEAFESTAVQFFDATGSPIGGTFTYDGFWATVPNASGSVFGIVNPDPITNGALIWTAEATTVIDAGSYIMPTTGTDGTSDDPVGTNSNWTNGGDGPNDDANVSALTLLGPGISVGGFRVTRFIEDVATVSGDAGCGTSTSTNFTTHLRGFTVTTPVPEPSPMCSLGLIGACVAGLQYFRKRKRVLFGVP